jgi:glutaminase
MVGDRLWKRVGREPSGNPFNSIVQLERERGVPRNPFINAGAIAVTDVILSGHQPREAIGEILRFMQFAAQDQTIVHRQGGGGIGESAPAFATPRWPIT